MVEKLKIVVPFSWTSTLWRMLDKNCKTLLDVGCGQGQPMLMFKRIDMSYGYLKKCYSVGVDVFLPSLKHCKKRSIYDDCVQCDVRKLPFKDQTFDSVLCHHLIEHLKKYEGKELITNLEGLAKKQVAILIGCSPLSYNYEHARSAKIARENGNPWQRHQSNWSSFEFRNKGYKVRGLYPFIKAQQIVFLSYILAFFLQPLIYFFPDISDRMFALKNM